MNVYIILYYVKLTINLGLAEKKIADSLEAQLLYNLYVSPLLRRLSSPVVLLLSFYNQKRTGNY